MSQAQQAAKDMINQTIAKMSFGKWKKRRRKLFKETLRIKKIWKGGKSELETVIVNCPCFAARKNEKLSSNRLCLILIAWLFRTWKTTCCMIRRILFSGGICRGKSSFGNRIGQSDRWSQNINLWMWFSFRSSISWSIHKGFNIPKRKANEMKFYWYWTRALTQREKKKDRKIYPVKNYYVNYRAQLMIIPRLSDTYKSPLTSSKGMTFLSNFMMMTKSIEKIFSAT